ncbi:MAG TPA: addiction module protein [Opitutaceae bacterium]
MSMTVDQLVSEARHLSPELRAELLDRLHLELHGDASPDVAAEWNRVALERLADVESGRSKTHSGEEVMTRMRRLVGR